MNSVGRIISELRRDTPWNINETDIIEWTGRALEQITTKRDYEEALAFIEVKDHQALLPDDLSLVIQVARNKCFSFPEDGSVCPENIVGTTTTEESTTTTPSVLDCNGNIIGGYELAYYRPYYDLVYEYELWMGHKWYQGCYTPVRLKNTTLFNTIVCTETDQEKYTDSQDSYAISGPYIRFSFKEGSIALAYLRPRLDEDGFPLIPDNESAVQAIISYITFKIQNKRYLQDEIPLAKKLDAEQTWHWYCAQAKNRSFKPTTIDDHQDILDQRSYLLPRQHKYYGFFADRSAPENRIFHRSHNHRSW
jgi:hypothetical protein